MRAIEKVDGLSSMDPNRAATQWPAGRKPIIIDRRTCCPQPLPKAAFMDEVMHDFKKGGIAMFSRGQPREPDNRIFLSSIVSQLTKSDVENPYYATNIPTPAERIQIPELVKSMMTIPVRECPTESNLTPKGVIIYIHIDLTNVITTISEGCKKLWGVYPLNKGSIEKIAQIPDQDGLHLEVLEELENGEWFVQDSTQAVFIPAGTIHLTLTLEGGYVPGITFQAAEDIRVLSNMWDLEQKTTLQHKPGDKKGVIEVFLKCFFLKETTHFTLTLEGGRVAGIMFQAAEGLRVASEMWKLGAKDGDRNGVIEVQIK
ncbi:hypothetical protein S40288_11643 [Stachybotrys chartarum IBT 40288]|nr:hypothetical protein S40288_11643 [Stachybotrys chartarum IBT 40288]